MLGDPIGRAIAAKAQMEYEDARRDKDNEVAANRFLAQQKLQRELAEIRENRDDARAQRGIVANASLQENANRLKRELNIQDNIARIEAARTRTPAAAFSFNDQQGVLGPTVFDRRTGTVERLTSHKNPAAGVDFSGSERAIAATRKEIAKGNKYTWMPDFLGRMIGAETTEQKLARQIADLEKAKRLGNVPVEEPQDAPAQSVSRRSAFEIPSWMIDAKAPEAAADELTPEDNDALAWAKANPEDSRSQAIINKINSKMRR